MPLIVRKKKSFIKLRPGHQMYKPVKKFITILQEIYSHLWPVNILSMEQRNIKNVNNMALSPMDGVVAFLNKYFLQREEGTNFNQVRCCHLIVCLWLILFHCLNTNISSYVETSGGQSSNLYLNVVHFCNTSVKHLWQHKTIVFLHWCLICIVLL